jgi:Phage portal protein, SPP1 Gp6-like
VGAGSLVEHGWGVALVTTVQTMRDQLQAELWGRLAADQLQQAQNELLDRQRAIKSRWEAYHGKHPASLQKGANGVDYNVRLNLARTIVDAGVASLFGKDGGVDIEVDQGGDPSVDTVDSPAGAYLADFWGDSKSFRGGKKLMNKESKLINLALDGGICGHVFCKLQPDEDADAGVPPRLVQLDPQWMIVDTDPDDVELITQYTYCWTTVDDGKPVARRQRTERDQDSLGWVIYDEQASGADWVLRKPPAQWDYEWSPVHHCQNLPMPNQVWGLSDLEQDTLDLNYTLNGIASDMRKITSLFASPVLFTRLLGNRATGEIGPGKVVNADNPQATYDLIEMSTPGTFTLELFDRLRDLIHETAEIPAVAAGQLDTIGPLSGAALNILYGPLVNKTTKKRGSYGDMIEEVSVHALELGGFDGVDVNLVWPQIIPGNPDAEVSVALAKQRVGYSKSTLIREMGGDPEIEANQRQQEQQDSQAAFDQGTLPGVEY